MSAPQHPYPLPGPKTLAERLEWLRADARRILSAPEAFKAEEVQWARDMLANEPPTGL
jgi:hypothetical protein